MLSCIVGEGGEGEVGMWGSFGGKRRSCGFGGIFGVIKMLPPELLKPVELLRTRKVLPLQPLPEPHVTVAPQTVADAVLAKQSNLLETLNLKELLLQVPMKPHTCSSEKSFKRGRRRRL